MNPVPPNDGLQPSLKETWRAFKRALLSPEPFNPFLWILRLLQSALSDSLWLLGCCKRNRRWKNIVVPFIPIFAVLLVIFCALSYPLSLRSVIRERWCCANATDTTNGYVTQAGNTTIDCTRSYCSWMMVHDFLVCYLPFMILYHFVNACFSSPGVVLGTDTPAQWTAQDGQGGCWGINTVLDFEAERKLIALYGVLETDDSLNKKNNTKASQKTSDGQGTAHWIYPSPYASYCAKCKVIRPPRSHHCSSSNRCVLQYDHFCVWLNNTVGLNNYRSFFLLLFYIMITCWYGVSMLFLPFYEPLKAQVREHGWRWLYSNGTGFLDLPPLLELTRMLFAGHVPSKVVIDIVYPLLLGVGGIMSGFFGYHVKYVLKGVTTLEHRVMLEHSLTALFRTRSSAEQSVAVNPFDQGWYRNVKQILGPNLWFVLLPVAVSVPQPYIPDSNYWKKHD